MTQEQKRERNATVVSDETPEDQELNNYYSTLEYSQRNIPGTQKRIMEKPRLKIKLLRSRQKVN